MASTQITHVSASGSSSSSDMFIQLAPPLLIQVGVKSFCKVNEILRSSFYSASAESKHMSPQLVYEWKKLHKCSDIKGFFLRYINKYILMLEISVIDNFRLGSVKYLLNVQDQNSPPIWGSASLMPNQHAIFSAIGTTKEPNLDQQQLTWGTLAAAAPQGAGTAGLAVAPPSGGKSGCIGLCGGGGLANDRLTLTPRGGGCRSFFPWANRHWKYQKLILLKIVN